MLLKFFSVNNGHQEPGGLSYLLKNPTARVVRGDPEITQLVIDRSPSNLLQRFTAGVINDLTELDESNDAELLDNLQELLLAGRPASSMAWCVIEHTEKGKREMHFVVALLDLLFGKPVHTYIDRIDRHVFKSWVELFALRYGLEIPSEKLRIMPAFEHLRMRKDDVEFLRKVWQEVDCWVRNGDMKNRDDLDVLLSRQGYEVRCHKYKGGLLQQPVILGPDGNQLRLKGSIYYRPDFGDPITKPLDRLNLKAVEARIAELRQIIRARMNFRAYHLIGRLFGTREKARVAKGKARHSLKQLIEQKLEQQRRANDLWQRVDFDQLCRGSYLSKAGAPTVVLESKKSLVAKLEPAGQASVRVSAKASSITMDYTIPASAAPVDMVPSFGAANDEPKAFQPSASGEMETTGTSPKRPAKSSTPPELKQLPTTTKIGDNP